MQQKTSHTLLKVPWHILTIHMQLTFPSSISSIQDAMKSYSQFTISMVYFGTTTISDMKQQINFSKDCEVINLKSIPPISSKVCLKERYIQLISNFVRSLNILKLHPKPSLLFPLPTDGHWYKIKHRGLPVLSIVPMKKN